MASFYKKVTPTVTAGAYSAGDIMGGLLTFDTGLSAERNLLLNKVQIVLKAAVIPALTLHLFDADPSSTTKTDNAAYTLNAADAFKLIGTYPVTATVADHGTPNSYVLEDINDVIPGPTFYGLLVDGTGVTLVAATDLQVTVSGVSA